ncbi:atypical chemokine receptor 1 [Pelodiscus sinensis]|uniref:atypical chemokine receptor 1 n=1 Tax=Pelodiscus sinensis TaxID=13735 RepID=UPI003F6A647B
MGNCFTTQPSSLQLNMSDFKELLLLNYTDYQDYDAAAAAPCHSSYCSLLGSSIPSFLAVICALGLLSNLALVVALVTCQNLWSGPPGRTFLFQLTLGTSLFTATLPFFSAGSSHGWVFGDGFCKVAFLVWYGSLFAEGLLVAASTCSAWLAKRVARQHFWGMTVALWVASVLLAVPAAFMSRTEEHPQKMCLWKDNSEQQWWSLAHVTTCLAVFILLPIALGVAKAMLTWHRRGWQLRVGVTWLFFLLWVPYGIALLLDSLQRRQLLSTSCLFWESLDFFLGLSEGLGILHCCLGPLLLLGVGLYHRRTDAGPGPLGMPGLGLASPQCSKPMSQAPQKA